MAVKIGTVFMDLRASSKGLEGDIKRAMGATRKSLKAAATDIAKVLGGTMAAAVSALALATRQGLKSVDDLAKASDKLGLTTEALQGLRRAAELTGVASNTLDMGIQRMTRRVSEAAKGTGEAKDALLELGLSAQRLNQLSPDKQFQAIARAMGDVTNQSDRVRLSMRLFDSEGVALVNTLKLGEQGLQDIQREIEAYGLGISRVDAAKVERANDAFSRASAILGGIGQQLAVEVAPLLEIITNRFLESAKSGNLVGRAVDGHRGGIHLLRGQRQGRSADLDDRRRAGQQHPRWKVRKPDGDVVLGA